MSRRPVLCRGPGLALALAGFLALAPANGRAQEPAQGVSRAEVVALDPDRGIQVMDAALRRELGLFPEVEGFVSATLLRPLDGRGWILEIVARRGDQTVRERRALDDAGLAALRAGIEQALAAQGAARVVEREGRGGVVLASTVLGLGYYGWALPDALGIDDERGVVAGYLLTAGASFLVPYLATRSRPVSRAAMDGTVWGGTRGIALGAVLGDLLALDASDDNRSRVRNGVGVAGSVLTGLAGFAYAGAVEHDRGRVLLAGALSDFALAGAFTTSYALGLYEGEVECFEDVCGGPQSEATGAGHAVGLSLGLAGVALAGRHAARTARAGRGDVRVLQSAGILGVQLVAPLGYAALHDGGYAEERAFAGILVAGAAAGLAVGQRFGMDGGLTPGDGLLVLAGHLAGGAGALGLTYLLDDGRRDATLYMATSAVGSLAGALFTYRAVRPRDGARDADLGSDHAGPSVEVHPLALFSGFMGGSRGAEVGPAGRRTPTLLTIRF